MYQRVMAIIGIISDYLSDDVDLYEQEKEIVDDLVSLGFDFPEIETAFSWIANLSQGKGLNRQLLNLEPDTGFQRFFTVEELRFLSVRARAWLSRLRQMDVLNQTAIEDIIDQALFLGGFRVGLEDIKVIATMVVLVGAPNGVERDRFLNFLENDQEIVFH
ncbi:MAG: DUF494 family protein [Deltaproteobacteria bacterium]|nr:DUF494 family protein [Deltaproteobacteria bacterium]